MKTVLHAAKLLARYFLGENGRYPHGHGCIKHDPNMYVILLSVTLLNSELCDTKPGHSTGQSQDYFEL